MEHYLTDKANKGGFWEYLVMIASGVLMMGFIHTGVKAFNGEHPLMSVLASATLTLLAAIPLILMLLRRDRRSSAKLLAEALSKRGEAAIPFARMDDITGVKDAAWKLYGLVNKGYMKNIAIDQKGKRVLLTDNGD